MKLLTVIAGFLGVITALSGCGAIQSQPIEIEGLVIRNRTKTDIRDVYLVVENTRTVVTCSFIPKGKQFSTEFPLRQYRGNYVITSWRQNNQSYKTRPIYANIPEDLDPQRPVRGEVIIRQGSPVAVNLVQE